MNRRKFLQRSLVLGGLAALGTRGQALSHELADTQLKHSPPAGVPLPPVGYVYYLGLAGENAGRCIYCPTRLDHPYLTGLLDEQNPAHLHPPLLVLYADFEEPGGRWVRWDGQNISPLDGFMYQVPGGNNFAWTGDVELAGSLNDQVRHVAAARRIVQSYDEARRRLIQARWDHRRTIRAAEAAVANNICVANRVGLLTVSERA